jgi:hypothetical protein
MVGAWGWGPGELLAGPKRLQGDGDYFRSRIGQL